MGQCSRYQMCWEDLEEYQALTFLTRSEILCIHNTFLKLCPEGKYYKEATLTMDQVSSLPALRVNPFRDRICRVFSHNNVFSFEDVLGMASVFSEQACPSLKIEYAFRIYDFNENGFIDEEDLQRIVLRLLNSDDVSEDLLMDLTQHVLSESDLDNDNMLSFSEFEHAMAKSPDFMNYRKCTASTGSPGQDQRASQKAILELSYHLSTVGVFYTNPYSIVMKP